ncbi:MAG TPA: ATP synthase F1 subunit delta, partial [Chloroflexota bacterium]|nr:ATP synthase F1 subunit delta [Chloroflexota bacterium]
MPGRTPAAKRYAEAVAAIARQENSWEQWRRDLDAVKEVVQNPQLRVLLESPRLAAGQRGALLDQTLGGKVAANTLNLLKVMGRRGRLGLLTDMLVWFDEIADRELGVRRFVVTTAAPLDDDQRARLRQRLGGGDERTLIITERVDPSLIGGLVLQEEDIIRDFSIKTRLE